MSRITLNITNSKTEETVGILTDVNSDTPLEELRKRIDSELSLNEYDFVVFGTALKRKQERKYLVSHVCVAKPGNYQHVYFCYSQTNLCSTKLNVSEGFDKKDKQDDSQPNFKSVVEKVNEKSFKDKVYTKDEIKEATGILSKERMTFFNSKSTEIASDPFFDDWGFHEIQGVIDVHWTLKKTCLLKSCVQELVSNTVEDSNTNRLTSIQKNSDKMEKAQFLTDKHYAKFCQEISQYGEGRRDELENQFDETFSSLKIAQADLLKSIEQYHKTATANTEPMQYINESEQISLGELNVSFNNDSACAFLEDDEMDILVDSVKDSFEQEN